MKKSYAEKKMQKLQRPELIKEQFEDMVLRIKKELQRIEKVDAVVIFGSFARGDYSVRHSDIDMMVFIDSKEKDPKLEESILKKIIGINMGKLVSVHTVFQYKRVSKEDSSLLLTISDEGKTVFSKKSIMINEDILGLKSRHLIIFDSAGIDQVKKNRLQRFLHGYVMKGKRYNGIIDNEQVISAGKGAIIVPGEYLDKVLLFADSIKVKAKQAGRFYR